MAKKRKKRQQASKPKRPAQIDVPIRDGEPSVSKVSDSMMNLLSGVGTSSDKQNSAQFRRDRVDRDQAEAGYRSDWILANIIDAFPDDMVREWRTFQNLEPDQMEAYAEAEEQYAVIEKLNETMKWSRLYGGCGLLMSIDGAGEFSEPLELDSVKEGSLKWLSVIDRNYLIPQGVRLFDVRNPNIAKPEFYYVAGGSFDLIHRSRLLLFDGVKMPLNERLRNQYWGGSVTDRVFDAVMHSASTNANVAALVNEAKVDAFGVTDLAGLLSMDDSKNALTERMIIGNLIKSVSHAVIYDKDREKWDQKTGAITPGLSDIQEQFLVIVAAAAGMPVTRLIGTAAQGMSATGEGDARNYYDAVSNKQKSWLGPQLKKLDEVLQRTTFGKPIEGFAYEWAPLWQASDVERSTAQLNDVNRDAVAVEMGAIDPGHVATRLDAEGIHEIKTEDIEAAGDLPDFEGDPEGGEEGEPDVTDSGQYL